jgi:hypothetical protein
MLSGVEDRRRGPRGSRHQARRPPRAHPGAPGRRRPVRPSAHRPQRQPEPPRRGGGALPGPPPASVSGRRCGLTKELDLPDQPWLSP